MHDSTPPFAAGHAPLGLRPVIDRHAHGIPSRPHTWANVPCAPVSSPGPTQGLVALMLIVHSTTWSAPEGAETP